MNLIVENDLRNIHNMQSVYILKYTYVHAYVNIEV